MSYVLVHSPKCPLMATRIDSGAKNSAQVPWGMTSTQALWAITAASQGLYVQEAEASYESRHSIIQWRCSHHQVFFNTFFGKAIYIEKKIE